MGLTEELVSWSHEQKCRKAVESLGKHCWTQAPFYGCSRAGGQCRPGTV